MPGSITFGVYPRWGKSWLAKAETQACLKAMLSDARFMQVVPEISNELVMSALINREIGYSIPFISILMRQPLPISAKDLYEYIIGCIQHTSSKLGSALICTDFK